MTVNASKEHGYPHSVYQTLIPDHSQMDTSKNFSNSRNQGFCSSLHREIRAHIKKITHYMRTNQNWIKHWTVRTNLNKKENTEILIQSLLRCFSELNHIREHTIRYLDNIFAVLSQVFTMNTLIIPKARFIYQIF